MTSINSISFLSVCGRCPINIRLCFCCINDNLGHATTTHKVIGLIILVCWRESIREISGARERKRKGERESKSNKGKRVTKL